MKLARFRTVLKFSPQISRFFSAIGLWMGLLAFLFLNMTLKAAVDPGRTNAISSIMTKPFSPHPHIGLGLLLRQQDRMIAAIQELRVAVDLQARGGTNVLGATTDPAGLLQEWETQAQRQAAMYRFWRGIAEDLPDYRDAAIMAASLAYQQSDVVEAERLAQATLILDPNNHEAQLLLKALE